MLLLVVLLLLLLLLLLLPHLQKKEQSNTLLLHWDLRQRACACCSVCLQAWTRSAESPKQQP
jgi:hypothetical protein